MEKLQIGSAVAEPGTRANGYLDVASYNDGSPVRTPVIVLHGAKPGPKLSAQGCIHGDEFCGTLGILKLCRDLNPTEMAGSFIGLPALNITAFRSSQRFAPYSYFGVPDLNRVFPGKADGNFNEIMAANIFKTLVDNADFMVDFHCGHNAETRWTLFNEDGSPEAQKSLELAKAFGIEIIYPCDYPVLQNAMFTQASHKGVPGIIVESGGGGELATEAAVNTVAEGLSNLLKYINVLEAPCRFKDNYIILKEWAWMLASRGGRFAPTVKINDKIEKDKIIARMYTLFDEELEPIRSPIDGLVLTVNKKPFVSAGDSIFQMGTPS
jgi:predicted deacylase